MHGSAYAARTSHPSRPRNTLLSTSSFSSRSEVAWVCCNGDVGKRNTSSRLIGDNAVGVRSNGLRPIHLDSSCKLSFSCRAFSQLVLGPCQDILGAAGELGSRGVAIDFAEKQTPRFCWAGLRTSDDTVGNPLVESPTRRHGWLAGTNSEVQQANRGDLEWDRLKTETYGILQYRCSKDMAV